MKFLQFFRRSHPLPLSGAPLKLCLGCSKMLASNQYGSHPRAKDGLQGECRQCQSVRATAMHAKKITRRKPITRRRRCEGPHVKRRTAEKLLLSVTIQNVPQQQYSRLVEIARKRKVPMNAVYLEVFNRFFEGLEQNGRA